MTKILIVDDNPEMQQLLFWTLSHEQRYLSFADTADAALATISVDRPDIILLDVMMPGALDGFQLCEYLKNHPVYNTIYILILTSRNQPSDFIEAKRVRCDEFIVKPFSPLDLIEKVNNVIKAVSPF